MATFVELAGDLLDRELGSKDCTVLFTTARRRSAVNEGLREFAKQTECWTRQSTITLSTTTVSGSSGVFETNLNSTITAGDYLWPSKQGLEVRKTSSGSTATVTHYAGAEFTETTVDRLNFDEPGWRTASPGTPLKFYFRSDAEGLYLGIWPAPDIGSSETWVAIVPYVAQPSSMTVSTQVPFSRTSTTAAQATLRPYHQGLVHYAAAQLEKLRKDKAASDRQMGIFAAYVGQYHTAKKMKRGRHVVFQRNYRRERRINTRARVPGYWA